MMLYSRSGDLVDVDLAGASLHAERVDEGDGRPWTIHVEGPRTDVLTGHYASRRHAEHAARILALHRGPR